MRHLFEGVLVVVVLLLGLAVIGRVTAHAGIGRDISSSSGQSSVHASGDTASASCTAADFSVSKLRVSTEYDNAKLTGIVTSHCTSAGGVKLKWTAYNADGSVAFSDDFWPASTTNIPPNTNYAFESMNTAPRGKWTYRVEPVSVDVW